MTNTRALVSGYELRLTPLGVSATSEDGTVTGLAVRFNSPTQIGDPDWGFREEFAAGAFTKTLLESDVVLLDNHDTSKPVARKSAGTLELRQDDGLRWSAKPADTSYARDMQANIKAGNYGGCSFGFRAVKEDWFDDDGNRSNASTGTRRIVREAQLFEVSPVTFPAYKDTEVSARDVVAAAREARAAKASYGDLDTCGECGAGNQYGQYCTECGEPMVEPKPFNKYCPACGGKLSGKRADHVCGEVRAKYSADDKKDMLAKGHAVKNAKGDPSYPIADQEDLDNAIHAVGRGGADHDDIRKYIMGRAKALGLSNLIPDNWNADGSITESKSAAPVITVTGNDYTDMAAGLVSAYNRLPADVREALPSELRAAFEAFAAENTPKPEHSTSDIESDPRVRMFRTRERAGV